MTRNNPITNTDTATRLSKYSKDDWRVVECLETGIVFLENPPETELFADELAWEKSYEEEKKRRKAREPVFSSFSDLVEAVRRVVKRRKRIVALAVNILRKQYRKNGNPLKMVDVGCGDAEKSRWILEDISGRYHLDIVPYGLEISNDLQRTALTVLEPYGGDVIHGSAIEAIAKLPDASMDLILICSFLEHEVDPLDLLGRCGEKLNQSGSVLIKVPNFNSLNRIIRQKRWCGFRYPDHVNYFTPKTLRMIIEQAGLEVARMNIFDRFPTNDNMYVIARRKAKRS